MTNSSIVQIKRLSFPWETSDPFLFCAHHADAYPNGNEDLGPDTSLAGRNLGQDFTIKDGFRMYHGLTVPGFPSHPHRGFETITIATSGLVDHADSLGAAGRFGEGDVQWMTAGSGVQHSEMFPLLNHDTDNPLEIFQIWLNLPKKSKMVPPHFSMLWNENIPIVQHHDSHNRSTDIKIIAGEYGDHMPPLPPPDSWASDTSNHVWVWTLKLEPHAAFTIPASVPGLNRSIYFYKGDELTIEEAKIPTYHSVQLNSDMDTLVKNGDEAGYILLLQGKPIDEPVAQYGPFVMNTQQEIMEAMNDYQKTQFGGWPWPRTDQVHDRKLGKFARHADGTEEFK